MGPISMLIWNSWVRHSLVHSYAHSEYGLMWRLLHVCRSIWDVGCDLCHIRLAVDSPWDSCQCRLPQAIVLSAAGPATALVILKAVDSPEGSVVNCRLSRLLSRRSRRPPLPSWMLWLRYAVLCVILALHERCRNHVNLFICIISHIPLCECPPFGYHLYSAVYALPPYWLITLFKKGKCKRCGLSHLLSPPYRWCFINTIHIIVSICLSYAQDSFMSILLII